MKIIGHRGAAGLALENSLESIKAGLKSGAKIVEFDVRLTRDNQIILNHDADLRRSYGIDLKIKNCTLRQLRTPCPKLPTLADALELVKNKTVIIELKVFIEPQRLFKVTNKYPNVVIKFASFNHQALRAIKKYNPESYCYVLEHHSPFEIINHASKMKADGIGVHYGILNPLTYLLARYKKLDVYTYTLNKQWIVRLIKTLYRKVDICTDYPNLMKKYERKP